MEKFSVLMSVYAKENPEFFELALASNMRGQTLSPDEFVLVCDGPLTAGLDAVVARYEADFPGIFKVYRKEHGGLGKALTFGLGKCSYELVARADSDDVSVPRRFESQVRFMMENPDIAVVGGHIEEFESDPDCPFRMKRNPVTPDSACAKARIHNPLNHMTVMFRRGVILSLGSYRDVPYVEDYDLWVRALVAGYSISNIDDVLVKARVGNGMVARRSSKKQIEGWRIIGRNMLEGGMISRLGYIRNMILIRGFVYMPVWLKTLSYKHLLRK